MSEIDRWHWSGSLCLYKDGRLVDEMKHSPILSSPSPAVVLYADHAAELAALRARVAELEGVLRALRDAAEASDDSLYGTLGTGFVRSVVDGALGLSPNKDEVRK